MSVQPKTILSDHTLGTGYRASYSQPHEQAFKRATIASIIPIVLVSLAALGLPCSEAWGRDAPPTCQEGQVCSGRDDNPPSCGPCGATDPVMQTVIQNLAVAEELPRFQAYVAATTNAPFDSSNIIAICGALSKFCWEDEGPVKGPEDSEMFNCRDYARWFRECLVAHGTPAEDVISQGFGCKNCDSGEMYGHVITIYRSEERWCPYDAQASPEKNQEFYSQCCNQDLQAAISCAHSKYCSHWASTKDPCCEADWTEDITDLVCRERCRFIKTIDGAQKLICDIPRIGTCEKFPQQTPYQPPPPTLCEQKVGQCLAKNPQSCVDCKRENIPECRTNCASEKTNEDCTACCRQQPPDTFTTCLADSKCADKPLKYPTSGARGPPAQQYRIKESFL